MRTGKLERTDMDDDNINDDWQGMNSKRMVLVKKNNGIV